MKRGLMNAVLLFVFCCSVCIGFSAFSASGQLQKTPISVAVLDFQPSGQKLAETGSQISAMLNARLSNYDEIILVERQELDKLLSEIELGLSGTITGNTAAKIGNLTGAKIVITGRVFESGKNTVVVAKIMGTETSRVYATQISIPADLQIDNYMKLLAEQIVDTLNKKSASLVAKNETKQDIINKLGPGLRGKQLPSVAVNIKETHASRPLPDPAVETEITSILYQLGFRIIDPAKSEEKTDIIISGEGFSEFAMRRGNLVSCKGRVELKAMKTNGTLVAVDRQTEIAVDISETIAAKKALEDATEKLIERIVPALIR